MFRRLFRIGFGGCGCALEELFRNHAVELARELLLKCYVEKLKKWDDMLSLDKFEMTNVGELKSNLKESRFNDETFNDKLEEITKKLDSWKESLRIAKESTGMSYEEDIVEVLSSIITEMENEVRNIKNKGSILLESLPVDTYSGSEEKDKRIYLYNQEITETRDLIVDQYEHAVIESQGFDHQPELQMLPFSIHEVRNEVYSNLKKKISKDNLLEKASGGYFFFVGLGGGTGTGVISPLAERFGKGSYGYFTLGVLGGKEDKKLGSQQPWFRRCFNMLLALNDLMVTAQLDGIILLDNDVIIKRLRERGIGVNKEEIDREIIEALYPAFGITALENKKNELDWAQLKGPIGLDELEKKPAVIVPGYASGYRNLEDLIEDALEKGKLANCKYKKNDEKESIVEKVFVYTRCIEDEDAVRKALAEKFEPIKDNDIVIIKEYLFWWEGASNKDVKKVKSFLRDYLQPYDITWTDKATIGWADNANISGKKDKNILKIENNASNECIKIVIKKKNEKETTISYDFDDKVTYKGKLPDLKVRKVNDEHYIYVKGGEITKNWIRTNLKGKKIVVFESQEIGTYWKVHDERYLFNWDNVSGSEKEKLKRFLVDDLGLKWVEGSKVEKNSDSSITIKKDNHSATIKKEEEKASLEIKDVGTHDLKVNITEDGKTNISVGRKNEVLVLLVNPDIRDALSERLGVARNFVWLIDSLKTLIDNEAAGSKLTKANEIAIGEDSEMHQRHLFSIDSNFVSNEGGIPEELKEDFKRHGFSLLDGSDVEEMKENEWVINNKDNVAVEKEKNEKFIIRKEDGKLNVYYPILENLPQDDIDTEKEKKPLAQARNFLLPEELAKKNENIFEHMKEILEKKLMHEAVNTCLNLKEGKWPIFKEEIFDITSISGKRDEVILSSISAMNENTKKTFDSLIGDAYNSYFDTFQRQFFKYNTRYLYRGGTGADSILSDEAEDRFLPEKLKDIIAKRSEPIKGEMLEELVKKHMDNDVLNVSDPDKISFSTMLALAGLYSKWQYLFSWDKNENAQIDKEEPMRKLFGWSVESNDFEIYPLFSIHPKFENELNDGSSISRDLKEEFKKYGFSLPDTPSVEKKTEEREWVIFDSEKKEKFIIRKEEEKLNVYSKKINLIINEKNEDATLIIRRSDSLLFTWKAGGNEYINLDEEIPKGLKDEFKNRLKVELKVDKMSKEEEQCWKIPYGNSYYYIHQQVNSKELEIYGDALHKLKVKKEEDSGKLKIYKRRGEHFD